VHVATSHNLVSWHERALLANNASQATVARRLHSARGSHPSRLDRLRESDCDQSEAAEWAPRLIVTYFIPVEGAGRKEAGTLVFWRTYG
jgi:hypothetical protein